MLIVVPVLIFVALVIVGAGVKIVPQGDWNCERVLLKDENIVHCQP